MSKYIGVFLCMWMVVSASAQYTNKSSVLDGSGTTSSGGGFTNISAAGQPGGIAESSGGSFVNQAGFLNTFFMKPGLDTDGDGIADEADRDNDNDALSDTTEIGGGAFSPTTPTAVNTRDSDSDGQSDGQESVAGTDPTNPDALLEITAITNNAGARSISWVARSNKTYRLLASDNGQLPPTNLIALAPANGFATPPWYVLTNSIGDAFPLTNRSFYAVEVQP